MRIRPATISADLRGDGCRMQARDVRRRRAAGSRWGRGRAAVGRGRLALCVAGAYSRLSCQDVI
eukprot:scaffold2187_cov109-Isochrysis_galbana.AAC.6